MPSLSDAASSAHSLTSKVAAGDPALVAMLEEDATPYSVSLPDNTVVPHDDCVCTLCNSILAAGLEVVSSSFCAMEWGGMHEKNLSARHTSKTGASAGTVHSSV